MGINDFESLNKYLVQFSPSLITDPGVYTLDRINKLMPIIGSPQEKLKVIHIAGTSGKTSTAYYISNLLSKTGSKVGLSVSPHINEVNERLQINNIPLAEAEFCKMFDKFIGIPGVLELQPSYFELLVAFAYWCFNELGCDYAVMEVGLGGLIDGTNVVSNPNKVAVITDIGLDHTRILGETVEEIAYQKAGIICSGNNVFLHEQAENIMTVVRKRVDEEKAILHISNEAELSKNVNFVETLPKYQKRNWLLANQVVDFVINRDGLRALPKHDLNGSQTLQIPGRMQTIRVNEKTLILDGAHNPQKLEALISSLKGLYPAASFSVLLSFGEAKAEALEQNLAIISELTKQIIVTEFSLQEDFAHRSVDMEKVRKQAEKLHINTVCEPDPHEAVKILLKQKSDILLITGSFYLIAAVSGDIKELS